MIMSSPYGISSQSVTSNTKDTYAECFQNLKKVFEKVSIEFLPLTKISL